PKGHRHVRVRLHAICSSSPPRSTKKCPADKFFCAENHRLSRRGGGARERSGAKRCRAAPAGGSAVDRTTARNLVFIGILARSADAGEEGRCGLSVWVPCCSRARCR